MVLSEMESQSNDQKYVYTSDKIVTVLLPLQKDANKSLSRLSRLSAGMFDAPIYIASHTYKDIFILSQPENYAEWNYDATCGFTVWVQHKDNGDRYQEKRTLNFVFNEDIPNAVKHSVAEDFFLRLNAVTRLSKDAIEFLMSSLVLLRDLPNDYINLIDIQIERVAESEQIVLPKSKDCEYDEEIEDLVVGHVQAALESAYPNALPFETIVEQLRSTPELITTYMRDLIDKGVAEQLENGDYIRVNTFAKIEADKIQKSLAEKSNSPTIAIICALYLESLTVSRIVENANTVHMYNLNGDSNVYTLGNIGPHRVVVTKLSMIGDSREATTSAGSITTRLLGNFQDIQHVLIVGVGGGVPHFTDPTQHIRLGDVVLSSTRGGASPAYVYGSDIVKDRITGSVTGVTARKWNPKEEKFIGLVHDRGEEIQEKWLAYADELINKLNEEKMENLDFSRPSADVDVIAVDTGDNEAIVAAHPNNRQHPSFHEGTIASMIRYAPQVPTDETETPIKQPSSQTLRNGFLREYNAKAFDAGFPSVIDSIKGNCIDSFCLIRGIADYHSGSSKVSKPWQPYSCANAAALTKVLIEMLPSNK